MMGTGSKAEGASHNHGYGWIAHASSDPGLAERGEGLKLHNLKITLVPYQLLTSVERRFPHVQE